MRGKATDPITTVRSTPNTRYVLITARIPIPGDQWEASAIIFKITPTLTEVEAKMGEAVGDPDFKFTKDIITPRPEGARRPGRKPRDESEENGEGEGEGLPAAAE